ncbi:DUF4954 domain-containing protein [Spirochaetia bacterium]|nr:DUF4954 domain-containing protein [Spirochaetia bacterium]
MILNMELLPADRYGYDFIPAEYLPPGKDEYWLRNLQSAAVFGAEAPSRYRSLTADEIAALEKNGCSSGCWADVLVTDPFDPTLLRNSSFYGLVRFGVLENKLLKYHDFFVPAGIRNSTIISSDIGGHVSIEDCSHISHYIIGDLCILSRIDEMVSTNHAKFGNGILKDGESEDVRVWIDVMNEAGGRSILPFTGMIPADAYLWAAYRDDTVLTEKLTTLTQKTAGTGSLPSGGKDGPAPNCRGFYGTIGAGTVIKSCLIIKDTAVGEGAYIKGANKLKNLTILSSEEEATQIGEGVELVNGIIGYGCHVFYGSKAVRFVLGNRCNLKYGARLIHSVLGDNSTVSCCEILNNLVFPVHEQHHNNSFLIAGLIEGMSNMAAGATVGSNHNSRANDGEIRAGRGFWPGLSVTLKHSSRFVSFCLIVKGDYPYELNITLPFSLVNNNVREDRLEVMPAYFWMYNLYALERNSWKTRSRDKRTNRVQRIEADYLAPDTAEEITRALEQLESWMAAAGMKAEDPRPAETANAGNSSLDTADNEIDPEYDYSALVKEETLSAVGLERHTRPTVILKPRKAAAAYREMLFYYGIKALAPYLEKQFAEKKSFAAVIAELENPPGSKGRITDWVNLGGQIIPAFRVDELRRDIREGKLTSWEGIHSRYDEAAAVYEKDRARHGWAILAEAKVQSAKTTPSAKTDSNARHPLAEPAAFTAALEKAVKISRWIKEQVYISRAKDFHDPFRSITYRNREEMETVVGRAEDNSFVKLAEENHRYFAERVEQLCAFAEKMRRH